MAKKKRRPVLLNLGCNRHPREGFVNCDLYPFPGVDITCDLTKEWPWDDKTIDGIVVVDLLEHLPDPVHFFNEAWRVLRPEKTLEILVPSTDPPARGAFQDPYHRTIFFNENSFSYYAVTQKDGKWISHPWRSQYAPYLIRAAFEVEAATLPGDGSGIVYTQAIMKAVKEPIWNAQGCLEQNEECLLKASESTCVLTTNGLQSISEKRLRSIGGTTVIRS